MRPLLPSLLLLAMLPAQEPPQLQSATPANGSIDVDWQLKTLEVRFDCDMSTATLSFCGNGPTFPRVTASDWIDGRTARLGVVLDPDTIYQLELSCAGSRGLYSKQGVRMAPTFWRFATRGERQLDAEQQRQCNQRAFELLTTAVRERYSYRDRLGIDWEEQFAQHRKDILAAPSVAGLTLRIADLLAVAQDPHISVQYGKSLLATTQRTAIPNIRQGVLAKELPGLRQVDKNLWTARTADGIGYLQLGTFSRDERTAVDRTIDALRQMRDCKGLILDLRQNSGGDEALARSVAAWFVRDQRVYAAHTVRNPDAPNGFDERQERSIRGNADPERFNGPIAVLTGPVIMSSAEAFLLMMKQAGTSRLIGATSRGSSGNPKPYVLAPGLTVQLPSWRALRPDGTCFEGEGIHPDIEVLTQPADFEQGDPVLQRALRWLREQ